VVNILHEDLLLIVKILTRITPPLLVLFGFILIEVNYSTQGVILDWRINLIGVGIIILGGVLLALELYLNMHKHQRV
jgi:hypothetical protein